MRISLEGTAATNADADAHAKANASSKCSLLSSNNCFHFHFPVLFMRVNVVKADCLFNVYGGLHSEMRISVEGTAVQQLFFCH